HPTVLQRVRHADYVFQPKLSRDDRRHGCNSRSSRPGHSGRSYLDGRCAELGSPPGWPASVRASATGTSINMNARLSSDIPVPDTRAETAARARQQQLTKPPGSLGRLEEVACWFAARLRTPTPRIARTEIFVFAADHGVAARGVSAFPQ